MAGPLDALASGGASILGRQLFDAELQLFDNYLKMLQKWQKSQRLIGSPDPQWIVDNLFLDSLLFLKVLPETTVALADVGSGAGLPGIPLKIVRPQWRVVLIESRAKRASFLSAAVRELGLRDTTVVTTRAEDYAVGNPAAFDAVVMRCAGAFREVAPAIVRMLGSGGVVVASGPPTAKPLGFGEWVEVRDLARDGVRRFAVYRVE